MASCGWRGLRFIFETERIEAKERQRETDCGGERELGVRKREAIEVREHS